MTNQNQTELLKLTVAEFAEELGEDYLVANSVIKFLEKAGIAKKTDETRVRAPGSRGKAAYIYEIPAVFELALFQETEQETLRLESAPVESVPAAPVPESAPESAPVQVAA